MSAKKRGRTRPGAPKALGLAPGGVGRTLGARGTCFVGVGWGSAEDPFPLRARAKASICDSVSRSEPQESGGGRALLGTAPHSGNPPAAGRWEGSGVPAPASRWGLEGNSVHGAGGSREPTPRLPGLSGSSAGLRACTPPGDLRGLAGWGRGNSWSLLRGLWGEFRGRVGEPAPPPGKQALPHILHAPRPFPAPSQPGEGPRATPLPAPRQAEPAPLQEVGAEPRPR